MRCAWKLESGTEALDLIPLSWKLSIMAQRSLALWLFLRFIHTTLLSAVLLQVLSRRLYLPYLQGQRYEDLLRRIKRVFIKGIPAQKIN